MRVFLLSLIFFVSNGIFASTKIVPKDFITEESIFSLIQTHLDEFNHNHPKEKIHLKTLQILSTKKFEKISNSIILPSIVSKLKSGLEDFRTTCESRCRDMARVISENGQELNKIPLYLEFEFQKKLWVAKHRLTKGHVFHTAEAKESWVSLKPMDHHDSETEDPKTWVGKIALRDIDTGTVLDRDWFDDPILIRRNSLVTLRVINGEIEITSRVKAMADGKKGDFIPFANLRTPNQPKQALVTSENELQLVNL